MKLVRVDMTQLKTTFEPVPPVYERLGGRALTSKLLLEEVPPTCDPLGAHNKLIFAPGTLAGANVTTAGRLSVGAKSPLTGGTKEADRRRKTHGTYCTLAAIRMKGNRAQSYCPPTL